MLVLNGVSRGIDELNFTTKLPPNPRTPHFHGRRVLPHFIGRLTFNNSLDCVDWLINHNADIDIKNKVRLYLPSTHCRPRVYTQY